MSIVIGVVLGIALIDFLVQNSRSARIEFFSASGRVPLSVALLAAALAGASVVVTVGIVRMVQLRRGGRHPVSIRHAVGRRGATSTKGGRAGPLDEQSTERVDQG